jgi:hypothetical protein
MILSLKAGVTEYHDLSQISQFFYNAPIKLHADFPQVFLGLVRLALIRNKKSLTAQPNFFSSHYARVRRFQVSRNLVVSELRAQPTLAVFQSTIINYITERIKTHKQPEKTRTARPLERPPYWFVRWSGR